MNKLNLTETDAVLLTLCSTADFIEIKSELRSFHFNKNGTTTAVYELNNHIITVKRDANNCTFDIQFHLKKHSTICGKKINPYSTSDDISDDRYPY